MVLREVGALPSEIQPKLRLLLEKRYRRVGDNRFQPSTAACMATTTCALDDMVAKGAFRSDPLEAFTR